MLAVSQKVGSGGGIRHAYIKRITEGVNTYWMGRAWTGTEGGCICTGKLVGACVVNRGDVTQEK